MTTSGTGGTFVWWSVRQPDIFNVEKKSVRRGVLLMEIAGRTGFIHIIENHVVLSIQIREFRQFLL